MSILTDRQYFDGLVVLCGQARRPNTSADSSPSVSLGARHLHGHRGSDGLRLFSLRRWFEFLTAFFAAMPGGLIEMVTLGVERGGDEKAIALIHASRIFLVVLTLPFLIQLFTERRSASPGAIVYPSRASNSLILGGSPLPLLQELEQASSCSFLPATSWVRWQ